MFTCKKSWVYNVGVWHRVGGVAADNDGLEFGYSNLSRVVEGYWADFANSVRIL